MDIRLLPEHERFREDVKRFLDAALDDDLRDGARFCAGVFQDYDTNMRWHRILYRQGWVAPSWPKRYGGAGWDLLQRHIWTTEASLAGAPGLAPMGLGMCGPMLIGHGTDEQRAYYLPRILSGEDYWCQGYSEPGSGSDLASLALRADIDGEDYVLNGTKIWTTHAHHANRMFCLVRTDATGKPQQGITFLLLDMDTPGIKVEPIVFVSGEHEVNQVFFDDVRVPRSNRVGAENDGWTVAKYLLEFERGGSGAARMQTALMRLKRLAASTRAGELTSLADDPSFASKIAMAEIDIAAIQYTEFRILAALSQGGAPGPESSILKNLGADMSQRISELAVEAVAYYGSPHQPEARTVGSNVAPIGPAAALVTLPNYLNYRASSIAGGTNEVQKNIVAKLVLGL
ncbi:MAG TPA: acyl-CoA dehydrogenase family protein [Pseudomonadales bacterium]|nr:acyl-CoA dehydrogenase family protein [Pseudomonadales bacterium]